MENIVFSSRVLIGASAVLGVVPMTALLSYAFARFSAPLAARFSALDVPSEARKIHQKPIPLWGGLGIALTIFLVLFGLRDVLTRLGPAYQNLRWEQLFGYIAGIAILLVGGMVDDRRPLPPFIQLLFPVLAAIAVIASGTGIVQITNPSTRLGYSLVWGTIGPVSLPSDLMTFFWLLITTYAMKILDGLDGLVAGLAVIGAGIVGSLSLSPAYFQPAVAHLSAVIGGAYLGFLPRNMNPAKQFLGESGATIAGFSLGVLAILSSAKVAIALSVLAIPITDVVLVVFGRIRRGVPWYRGDNTHLHFRLLQAGLSQRAAVFLLWSVSLFAGLIALSLQTRGKLFLIGTLVVLTVLMSAIAGVRSKRRTSG